MRPTTPSRPAGADQENNTNNNVNFTSLSAHMPMVLWFGFLTAQIVFGGGA